MRARRLAIVIKPRPRAPRAGPWRWPRRRWRRSSGRRKVSSRSTSRSAQPPPSRGEVACSRRVLMCLCFFLHLVIHPITYPAINPSIPPPTPTPLTHVEPVCSARDGSLQGLLERRRSMTGDTRHARLAARARHNAHAHTHRHRYLILLK